MFFFLNAMACSGNQSPPSFTCAFGLWPLDVRMFCQRPCQERAVVTRANEMRARRARLDVMRSEILDLERAKPLLPPSPPMPPPPSITPTPPPGKFRDFSRECNDNQDQQPQLQYSASAGNNRVGVERRWLSTAVEEAVIEEAEKGVLLVPLKKEFGEEQAAAAAGLGEGRTRGKPAEGDDGVGTSSESGKGRWRLARGFWRWIRGY